MPGQILLVEDDPTFLHVAAELIRVDGHIVLKATDGMEALELLRAGQFDVVLTDFQMPKMNGIELIKAVKEIDPAIEVVVMTGYSTVNLAIDIIRSGGFDLLRKPEDIKARMRMTINQALERRQLNSKNKNLVTALEQKIVEKTSESRRLAAQYQVTSILTGSDTLTDVAPRILKTLLNNLGWHYGAIWSAERFTNKLHCTCICARSEEMEDPFIVKRKTQIFQIGEGLPGKVWEVKTHLVESDTPQGLGFPILFNDRMLGVLEFHHSEISEPDAHLVNMMTAICNQLGLFIEREQLEQQFRQSQKLEAIGRLASGISHDFNNLLTSIMGYAHLIEGQVTKHETLHRNAQQIQKTSHRAASLIQQLLTLSRSQVMKPELCDLNQVIYDIQPMLARLLTESIEFRTELMEPTTWVMTDKTQIEQVIVNLAVNARDAMEEGGTLTIESRLVQLEDHDARVLGLQAGQYIQLNVKDTGHGMDETVKRHLFEPFFTTKNVGKGSGLGLATVYGIVTQSGGNIEVQSSPGEGTTFSVYLPGAKNQPNVEIQNKRTEPQDQTAIDPADETILIVDDADEIREIMQTILSTEGYTVYEASDGIEALDVLKKHHDHIDLIISDIYMPKMMGDVFIEEVKKAYPAMNILLISGMTAINPDNPNAILQDYPFLPKPFTPEALIEKVRLLLDTLQYNHQTP